MAPQPQLTQRDEQLLLWLRKCYYLRTSQVLRLGWNSYRYAVRRLNKQLVPAGYLKVQTLERHGENVYSLGPRGRDIVQDLTGERPDYRGRTQLVRHSLDVAEVLLWFKNNGELGWFATEPEFRFQHLGKKITYRPDAVGKWDGRGFILEVERRNGKANIEDKVQALEAFFHSGRYEKLWPKFPPVYILCKQSKAVIRAIEQVSKLPMTFYVSDWDFRWQKITGGGGG